MVRAMSKRDWTDASAKPVCGSVAKVMEAEPPHGRHRRVFACSVWVQCGVICAPKGLS